MFLSHFLQVLINLFFAKIDSPRIMNTIMSDFAVDLSNVVRHVDDVNCMHSAMSNCPCIKESWGNYFHNCVSVNGISWIYSIV